jgi:hypothetical protein
VGFDLELGSEFPRLSPLGFGLREYLKPGFAINRSSQVVGPVRPDYPQRGYMDPLDRLGVLGVGINTSFVPPDFLTAFPASPISLTRGSNASDYANECW